MGTIKRFEDIEAWKKARIMVRSVYSITTRTAFAKDFGLKDQIQRAAVSVMANIAEGFDTGTNREFIRYLLYSRASLAEVQSHLYVALDREYITDKEFNSIYCEAGDTGKCINGFVTYLKRHIS
jgi:four helix bundle protein